MNARRSGIIIKMPSAPPSTAATITWLMSILKPSKMTAGMVTPMPKAIDSPAEPAVCTMLFSKIVARRTPKTREKRRKSVIERTATGIDADTVMPTFSTRYSDEAPKTIPSRAPTKRAGQVNSGRFASLGT